MRRLFVGFFILIGIGLFFSYRDWKAWRYEETKNFGFGPGELYSPAVPFTEHFSNQFVGVRFNYPQGWKVDSNAKLEVVNEKLTLVDVIGTNKTEVVRFGRRSEQEPYFLVMLKVDLNIQRENLVDMVNRDIEKMKKDGYQLAGERRYINSDRANWTVVNFDLEGMRYMKAYTNFGEKHFELEIVYSPDEEFKMLNTYEELIKAIIPI